MFNVTQNDIPFYDKTIRLYKKTESTLEYRIMWEETTPEQTYIILAGKAGEKGHKTSGHTKEFTKTEMERIKEQGFAEFPENRLSTIYLKFNIAQSGSEDAIKMRREFEEKLGELLCLTGLGICDGGSSGKETFEIFCQVVDPEMAIKVMSSDLKETRFSAYKIFICDEDDSTDFDYDDNNGLCANCNRPADLIMYRVELCDDCY